MNNKFKILSILMLFLIGVLSIGAQALQIAVDEVSVEGTSLAPAPQVNWLDLERGQEIEVRIELTGLADVDNVEVMAFISGYEYNDQEPMSDTTHVFDVEENVTYVKKLNLVLPSRVEEDNYLLRIIVSDRAGDEIVENYQLKVDVPRHALEIRDVIFSPEDYVQTGRALLTTVRIKNIGDKTEDSVKVSVSIPALGISASDYIDEIEAGDSTTSEELYMRIPPCAESGDYTVKVDVEYDEGFEEISTTETITVEEGDTCIIPGEEGEKEEGKTIITISTEMQDVTQGQGGAVYPITLTNGATVTKTYIVSVTGTDTWATTRISPSNIVVLDGGKTQTVFVYISASKDAPLGERMFSVSVSSAGEELKQIPLKANVVKPEVGFDWDNLRKGLEIGFVILVIILVVLGLIIGFSKLREKEEPEEISGQTYY